MKSASTRPCRAVVEELGWELAACVWNGFVDVAEPELMPLPEQELIVRLANEMRADGVEPDPCFLAEYAARAGTPEDAQRALHAWCLTPNVVVARYFGTEGNAEHLREKVFAWSQDIRTELLVCAAAAKVQRGQSPKAELERLRRGT